MEENVRLQLLRKLSMYGIDFLPGNQRDIGSFLDELLKVMLQDRGVTTAMKLNAITFLESESVHLLRSIADVELAFATFKNVFETAGDGAALLQGQCLISMTSVLLQAFTMGNEEEEFQMLLSDHVNNLLTLVKQNNNIKNVYTRSVAANCLLELELCFPNMLRACLDCIYTISVQETTAAHQQYVVLLAAVVKHSVDETAVHKHLQDSFPKPTLKKTFVTNEVVPLTFSDLNQMVSFMTDQLSLCTSEGVVYITTQLISLMICKKELQTSAQVLKPLLFNYAHTYSIPVFHVVLMLEKELGNILFEEQDHSLLLHQLLLKSNHPGLPAYTKLVYLDYLNDYLSRKPHKVSILLNTPLLFIGSFDGPETQLKKLHLLSSLLKNAEEAVEILIQAVSSLQKQIKIRTSIKLKSAFTKTLFRYLVDHQGTNMESEIARIVLSSTTEDVTMAPFTLNFVQKVQEYFPRSSLPASTLTSLVAAYTKPNSEATLSTLHFTLDIFLASVLLNCNAEQPKAILIYLLKYALSDDMCESMNWALGHQILFLCYSLMRKYDTRSYFYELSDVLKVFMHKSKDMDHQDRAQLYYALLVSLSNNKLKAVLKAPTKSITNIMSQDSKFNSNSSIQNLNKPLLLLRKVKCSTKTDVTNGCIELPADALSVYSEFTKFSVSGRRLQLKVSVDFVENLDETIHVIEAVALFFSSPESWGQIEPVMVGHLDKKRITAFKEEQNEITVFDVHCFPAKPHPVLAEVRAEFSLGDVCHICSLDPLKIEFLDFFCPLPVPEDYILCSTQWRTIIFNLLWELFENGSDKYSSIHVLQSQENRVKNYLNDELGAYLIQDENAAHFVGIYLPPSVHLLMKFHIQQTKTVLRILTDDLHVLAYANDFFQSWIS